MANKATSSGARAGESPLGHPVRSYLRRSASPLTALVLVLPLLLLYNGGVALEGWSSLNGADIITLTILRWTGRQGWMVFQGVLAVSFVGAIVYLRRRGHFQFRYFFPLVGESALYALSMGSLILALMEEAHILGSENAGAGLIGVLTISAGAGVHEELLFRLALIPLLALGFRRGTDLGVNVSLALAVVISSTAFSLAHYVGPESFALFSFVYRTLAGLVFSLLYLFRGFAVAVYTHFFYDVYVMSLD